MLSWLKRSLSLLFIAASVGAVQAAQTDDAARNGTTFYVSLHGDDTDGSSWGKAFNTIQKALDAIPDNRGGHRICIRPGTYVEANLYPAHPGAPGAYNVLEVDHDGAMGSGAAGWAVIDSGDPRLGFKSYDWHSTIRSYQKGWSADHREKSFSSLVWDRWHIRHIYATGSDAGLFFDMWTDLGAEFSVIVEDSVGIGRAFGGGAASYRSRPDEPVVFRRCTLWSLDWWGDAAAALVRDEHGSMPEHPSIVFEECTMVAPDNALAAGNPTDKSYTRVRLTNCQLISLNFSQPHGMPSTGTINSPSHGRHLHVDLEDSLVMGYKVFGTENQAVGGITPGDGEVSYAVHGDARCYVQFQQSVPKGFTRLTRWPVEVFTAMVPPDPQGTAKVPNSGNKKLTKVEKVLGDDVMESQPFIYQGRPLLFHSRRAGGHDATPADCYLYIADYVTGEEITRFGQGHSFGSVFVDDDVLHVFAAEYTDDWTGDIYHLWTGDLKTWQRELAIKRVGGEHLFNTSVTRDEHGYVMAYESNEPVAFCFRFARSTDLHTWTPIEGLVFTGKDSEYSACPTIRYIAPYYYVIYLHAPVEGHRGWISYVTRSKDLETWQLSPRNPILEAEADEGVNNSDVDLFELDGKTYVFYATGDQNTWLHLKHAVYPGPLDEFFASYFPAGVDMVEVSTRTAAPPPATPAMEAPTIDRQGMADSADNDRMAWWREARFGLFIHWGLYSAVAGQWKGQPTPGLSSWTLHSTQAPLVEYTPVVDQFNPIHFDADAYVKLAKDAGMKYIVITTKHHEGFCLYDSRYTDFDVMASPFQRDIMRELAEACRRHGVRIGWYYSILDWHHPDYLPRRPGDDRPADVADFDRYITFMKNQLSELLTNYGPIDILWFDGEWDPSWNHQRGQDLYDFVRQLQPSILINNRVDRARQERGSNMRFAGDFGTPEQEIPPHGVPGVDWETCMTINDTWGYKAHDHNWKSTQTLLHQLVDVASKGGNYLLNIGPRADGSIPEPSIERLRDIGRWMRRHGASIHGTTASPFTTQLSWGRCTRRTMDDGTTRLYLHVFDWPSDGILEVPTLAATARKAFLLTDATQAPLPMAHHDEHLHITVPRNATDKHLSVVVLDLQGG